MANPYGLTGGIGTGKSTVLNFFEEIDDVYTIQTDSIAKDILQRDNVVFEVSRRLGSNLIVDGQMNVPALSKLVFSDAKSRKILEELTHPLVWQRIEKLMLKERNSISFYLVESAIIFEINFRDYFKKVICTTCSLPTQIKRVKERSGLSEKEIMARIHAQIPNTLKEELSDFVIDTDGSIEEVKEQVHVVYRQIKEGVNNEENNSSLSGNI